MTRFQYLMMKLMEECSEISQEASKCALFGYDSCEPITQIPNIKKLHNELNDFMAIIDELNDNYHLNYTPCIAKKNLKRQRLEHYRLLAANQTLN